MVIHVEKFADVYDVIPNYDPDMDSDVVVIVGSSKSNVGGFTPKQLRDAFDYIQDDANWKNPFCALVPRDMLKVVEDAAVYFAATLVEVFDTVDPDTVVVEGAGYYARVGA